MAKKIIKRSLELAALAGAAGLICHLWGGCIESKNKPAAIPSTQTIQIQNYDQDNADLNKLMEDYMKKSNNSTYKNEK